MADLAWAKNLQSAQTFVQGLPCAGFVPLWASPIIGVAAGAVCYLAVQLKNKMKWDDALDVWGVHGIGGVIGTILLGVFASSAVNAAGADGLLFGGGSFFVKELVAVAAAAAYAFIFTYIMLILINMIVKVRVSEDDERKGLDASIHGETAYDEGAL